MGVLERRVREKKERRDAILAAASRVFLEQGLGNTTMQDIAREAELSKGALYLYFKNKDELFLQIALSALTDLESLVESVASSNQAPEVKVREMLERYIQYATEQRSRFQVAMSWLSPSYSVDGNTPVFSEYRQLVEKLYHSSIALLKQAEETGALVLRSSPERTWFQFWGALLGLLTLENSHEEVARRIPLQSHALDGLALEFIDTLMSALTPAQH